MYVYLSHYSKFCYYGLAYLRALVQIDIEPLLILPDIWINSFDASLPNDDLATVSIVYSSYLVF